MPEQLEFDLVSPYLMGRSPKAERMILEAAELMALSKETIRLAKLEAELQHQDLMLDPKPTNELDEVRLIIGPEAWKKTRRRWERRLKQDLITFRKVLIVLRNLQRK
jgi:hypothetical protein